VAASKAKAATKTATKSAVTIWHNPKCATSRKVLGMIRERGIELVIVEYVKAPPSAADIKTVLKESGLAARELLRRRGTPYDELKLGDANKTDASLIAAMAEHPILIERPVVRTRKGTRLCRPPERVTEIL
jgi:arsenate reductase (glutaredoxin)